MSDRKQGVSFNNTHSQLKPIVCGVPQGSILGPLLFLIYINDLYLSSKLLHFILFADDTNLFFSHKNLKTLFSKMNAELSKINEWFKANKLSLNVTKTKYILFLKPSKVDDIPLKLPDLNINNINIKRVNSMKFLGVILDQHLNWKEHLKLIENKTSKCIGIMHRAKYLLNHKCLKHIYFAFIHSYLNYCNMAWASTYPSHLRKLVNIKKKASRIILNKNRYESARPLLKELGILNVYQLNLYPTLIFMFKLKHKMIPEIFQSQFSVIDHRYPTRYSSNNFKIPKTALRKTDFSISCRGPRIWNNFLLKEVKDITNLNPFKRSVKSILLNIVNEIEYF